MITIYYGTRPEYIKVYPLYKKMKEMEMTVELVKIGQHTDLTSAFYYDKCFDINNKNQHSNRLNSVVSSVLFDEVVPSTTKLVVVQGDTATAFGVALNAFNKKIPIAHIEAGLRTYDIENPFPEEAYRRFISVVTSYHFCVSDSGLNNLQKENVGGEKYVVGNTVLDVLLKHKEEATYGNTVLVTLHRRENKEHIHEWLEAVESLARSRTDLEFILPIHPNLNEEMYKNIFSSVKIVNPLSHEATINILKECRLTITDSGGIQEESSFFGKRSVVCRKKTEREDGLGTFSILCNDPSYLKKCFEDVEKDFVVNAKCPYGDGKASEKIANIIKNLYT